MIISRWKGFEIDSSEGYYGFTSDITDLEERWQHLNKILNSSLLWDKAAFDIGAVDREAKKKIQSHFAALEDKGKLENTENIYNYCPYVYAGSLQVIQDVLQCFRERIESVWLNFCIRPLKSLEADEYGRMKTWFLGQFTDKKEGQARWREYKTVKEKDLTLGGNQTYTDSWTFYYAFEASLQFYPNTERGLSIYMSAGDPSLVIYLIATVFPDYDLEFFGDHYISIDRRPDKLRD